eukprot:CAMPEP_0197838658 /NCGR_PEP_ID=MMETSP1437-20131217/37889_1 /TAXON_ID=49252 ORGANISM="Eucampia antarctica, Strain CCMP1452" /NCGR_SAMPLE_ID=MMETSP1437 /ASSEMBLY_ACC=CAM_ASM_001096 /LENGTH=30 /DNA_ID= /DNA_START= /DNA_END= /DNA_ORIENTATION=
MTQAPMKLNLENNLQKKLTEASPESSNERN